MENIVIAGSGGCAKEVKWLIDRVNKKCEKWNFCGYIDKEINREDVIGNDQYVLNMHEELSVVIAIGNPKTRMRIYKNYSNNRYIRFPNLIDPSVYITDSIKMGDGNIICANNIFTVDICVGNFNIVNLGCTISHDVTIGDFNTVGPGTNMSGNVTIGDLTYIGTGSQIIQGRKIADEAVIGAGAVVITDIPRNTLAVGVPAVIKKMYEA